MPITVIRDEASRLAALDEYGVLDTPPEPVFERIVGLVQQFVGTAMATVTFIDAERQWFKARRGVASCETARREAVCDHTIRSAEPLVVDDLREDERFRDFSIITDDPPILSYLGVPLVTPAGYALGALCALDHVPRQFTQTHVAAMQGLAGLVVEWLEMRRIAQADYLTGAMTRRALIADAEREILRFQRYERPCALVVFDVDHFKAVNDTHGHTGGDNVLQSLAKHALAGLRSGDIFARLGGEEFALLLPETEADEAFEVAERLREEFATLAFPGCGDLRVTASFGVAPYDTAIIDAAAWVDAADRALYRAKDRGRNRTVISGQ